MKKSNEFINMNTWPLDERAPLISSIGMLSYSVTNLTRHDTFSVLPNYKKIEILEAIENAVSSIPDSPVFEVNLAKHRINDVFNLMAERFPEPGSARSAFLMLLANIVIGVIANLPGNAYAKEISTQFIITLNNAMNGVLPDWLVAGFPKYTQGAYLTPNTFIQYRSAQMVAEDFMKIFRSFRANGASQFASTREKFKKTLQTCFQRDVIYLFLAVALQGFSYLPVNEANQDAPFTNWLRQYVIDAATFNKLLQMLRSSMAALRELDPLVDLSSKETVLHKRRVLSQQVWLLQQLQRIGSGALKNDTQNNIAIAQGFNNRHVASSLAYGSFFLVSFALVGPYVYGAYVKPAEVAAANLPTTLSFTPYYIAVATGLLFARSMQKAIIEIVSSIYARRQGKATYHSVLPSNWTLFSHLFLAVFVTSLSLWSGAGVVATFAKLDLTQLMGFAEAYLIAMGFSPLNHLDMVASLRAIALIARQGWQGPKAHYGDDFDQFLINIFNVHRNPEKLKELIVIEMPPGADPLHYHKVEIPAYRPTGFFAWLSTFIYPEDSETLTCYVTSQGQHLLNGMKVAGAYQQKHGDPALNQRYRLWFNAKGKKKGSGNIDLEKNLKPDDSLPYDDIWIKTPRRQTCGCNII